jgi:hypothetical protein
MMAEHPGMLEILARSVGARVESCQHFNPNVGEWARQQVRTRLGGYRVTVSCADSRVAIEVKGFETQISFSVNDVDRVCLLNRPLDMAVVGLACPVFVAATSGGEAGTWIQQPENVSLVSRLHLEAGESLQVYRNAVVLIGRPERATRDAVLSLCRLADRLRERDVPGLVDGLSFSPQALPWELRHLEDLIRRFATGDDVLREELLASASAEEREELRTRVDPLVPRINEFLDSFGSRPLTNEATLIARLAEAVDELRSREA